jgi:hypothetical protein
MIVGIATVMRTATVDLRAFRAAVTRGFLGSVPFLGEADETN